MPDVFVAMMTSCAQERLEPRVQLALRRRLFDDGFDDQVALREPREIVGSIADLN